LNLPGEQQKLMKAVAATGKPVVLVLLSGSALTVNWAGEHIPAIVQAWYPGAMGGKAIASLLFGDYSPSGRLPVTFYRTSEELPDFHDYSMENRTYRYMKNEALYSFGYGLSYTEFEYTSLELSGAEIPAGADIYAKVNIRNVGKMISEETVQLYLQDAASDTRVPKWQLAGIKKVCLNPGESVEVSFAVSARQMCVIDENGHCILEPGEFRIYIGGSQPDTRSAELTGHQVLSAGFTVTGSPLPMER
jgi:beta-glucosidase